MAFSKKQLTKFADLIHVEIPDDKLENMGLDVVFDWVDELKATDTTGVSPMFSPARHSAPTRPDVVTAPNMRTEILKNVPDTAGVSRGYFSVPKVMEE